MSTTQNSTSARLIHKIDKYRESSSCKSLEGIKHLIESEPSVKRFVVEYLKKESTPDAPHIALIIASLYKHGVTVAVDLKKAIKYYKLAEKHGDSRASAKLGKIYLKRGHRYIHLAFNRYRRSAEQGNAEAQYKLGYCYEYGVGVEKNRAKAFECYKRSADQGFKLAQRKLKEWDRENEQSLICCKQLIKQGSTEGQDRGMGYVYYEYTADDKDTFRHYKLLANQGDTVAQRKLGVCYEEGIGVNKNKIEAFKCYISAGKRDTEAQNRLGGCYEKGLGVASDQKRAFENYRLSANDALSAHRGNDKGLYNLGRCYEEGIGIAKNIQEAYEYYRLSADQGNKEALNALVRLYGRGIGTVKDAVKYYTLASRFGDAEAQYRLGRHYEEGIGVKKDRGMAIKLYKLSKDQGNIRADYKFTSLNDRIADQDIGVRSVAV